EQVSGFRHAQGTLAKTSPAIHQKCSRCALQRRIDSGIVQRLERPKRLPARRVHRRDHHVPTSPCYRQSHPTVQSAVQLNPARSPRMNNAKNIRFLALILLCLALAPLTAMAQSSNGSISGNITDDTGAAIPGVTVSAVN